jgi:hypothetical protein
VFVVCCVGSRNCDKLITRPEEYYQARARVCVCVCVRVCVRERVIQTPQQLGGPDLSWAVESQKETNK